MPFFQYDIEDNLSYELTFNSYGKVIVSTDTNATHSISDIRLEFDVITSSELAAALRTQNQGKQIILYDKVQELNIKTLNKRDRIWDINITQNFKSLKGILILFIDPNDGGQLYDRDSEKFYDPKINKVSITIDGRPNQLYSSGMLAHQQFEEIRKHFADGKHRTVTVNTVAKDLELSDMTLEDFCDTKYGLWLDMRTTDDDALHGSGRKIEDSIHIQINKESEAEGELDAHIYYICDAQLNFDKKRLLNVVY